MARVHRPLDRNMRSLRSFRRRKSSCSGPSPLTLSLLTCVLSHSLGTTASYRSPHPRRATATRVPTLSNPIARTFEPPIRGGSRRLRRTSGTLHPGCTANRLAMFSSSSALVIRQARNWSWREVCAPGACSISLSIIHVAVSRASIRELRCRLPAASRQLLLHNVLGIGPEAHSGYMPPDLNPTRSLWRLRRGKRR